jgi:tRNA(Ile)-lysidine synthase
MKKALLDFLKTYLSLRPPLVLGLSGGPDSMALFHLLLEENYPFEVAHMDHAWRPESLQESSALAALCAKFNVPFHLKRLAPPEEKKNLEERGREARLAFFKKVVMEQKLKGVLLAHHADDHAETVLKRVFEGATLPKLKGLLPKTELGGLVIYRPLLKVGKKDILKWLQGKQIAYFYDRTNDDPCFLRSRLRHALIPALSDQFGKEVSSNLCRLGEAAAELDLFLKDLGSSYLARVQASEACVCLDFAPLPALAPFVWKAVLRQFFDSYGVSLPHQVLSALLMHLQKGSCHKKMKIGCRCVAIHKKKLILELKVK